jgi:hypothetical protein
LDIGICSGKGLDAGEPGLAKLHWVFQLQANSHCSGDSRPVVECNYLSAATRSASSSVDSSKSTSVTVPTAVSAEWTA